MTSEVFYITTDGKLIMKNNTLYFVNKEGKVVLPIEKIKVLYFLGSGSVSTSVLKEFKRRNIPIHFFDRNSYYIGSFYPKDYLVSGEIIVRQVQSYLDQNKRLKLASKFTLGAYQNINWICNRFKLGEISYPNFEEAKSIEQLMQKEGMVRKKFYELIDSKLLSDFKIVRREIMPPSNRGNAILSFLNSLVYTTVASEIYFTHLHPAVSFLHQPFERRYSLSLDVSEIFKPLLSERLLLRLVDLKMLDPIVDFMDKDGIFLSEIGRKKLIKAYDEELNKTIKMKNKNYTIRQLIRNELYKLEKDLLGLEEYRPLKAWW